MGALRPPVRMFKSSVGTPYGGVSETESFGLTPNDVAVIEADNTITQADSIKVAYDVAPATGHDIFRHPCRRHPAGHQGATASHRRAVSGLKIAGHGARRSGEGWWSGGFMPQGGD